MSWSKLEGTEICNRAKAAYDANALAYHSFEHVQDLYRYAEALGIPYDEQLDHCILAHDVIMHLGPGANERASAQWLATMLGRPLDYASPILATIDHSPDGPVATIALLDLMSFTDKEASDRNTELLIEEARFVKGDAFDYDTWIYGTLGYLRGLEHRIAEGLERLSPDAPWRAEWSAIADGVRDTILHRANFDLLPPESRWHSEWRPYAEAIRKGLTPAADYPSP